MKFANILNEIIYEKRITINQISQDTNISVEVLKNYSNDKLEPTNEDIKTLSNYFKVDLLTLINTKEVEEEDKIISNKYLLLNRILIGIIFGLCFIFVILLYANMFDYVLPSYVTIKSCVVNILNYENNFLGSFAVSFLIINALICLALGTLDVLNVKKILKIDLKIYNNIVLWTRTANYLLFIVNMFLVFFAFNYCFYFIS